MLAKKNAETYEIVFDFIPKNYIDSNPYPAEITPSVSDTESTKTNEIPASIWPVMNTGDKIKSFVRSSMPFSEVFGEIINFRTTVPCMQLKVISLLCLYTGPKERIT